MKMILNNNRYKHLQGNRKLSEYVAAGITDDAGLMELMTEESRQHFSLLKKRLDLEKAELAKLQNRSESARFSTEREIMILEHDIAAMRNQFRQSISRR
jgi:t-SNARE complex subunit (syntaxin)